MLTRPLWLAVQTSEHKERHLSCSLSGMEISVILAEMLRGVFTYLHPSLFKMESMVIFRLWEQGQLFAQVLCLWRGMVLSTILCCFIVDQLQVAIIQHVSDAKNSLQKIDRERRVRWFQMVLSGKTSDKFRKAPALIPTSSQFGGFICVHFHAALYFYFVIIMQ